MEHQGILTVVPTAIVLVLAIVTRRATECLLVGALVGMTLLDPSTVLSNLADTSLAVLTNRDVAWTILVCCLMGSMIGLWIRSGAIGLHRVHGTLLPFPREHAHGRVGARHPPVRR